ncbi:MAG TPA: hypothetical protein VFQ67_00175 [Allosphingosinicella sp.]|jgi:hypothetical protein|nr:hypothetical protein [Allosphingosinicella sp.]
MSGAGLVLLGLAACNPAPAPEGGGSGDSANVAAAAPARAAAPAPAVVLEGAGLRIAGATPPRTLAFGIPAAEAIAALTEAFGRPPSERGENEECGGGAMAFAAWDGKVTIWLLDGRFAGWDDKGGLRTLEGVAVGSSRSDVESLPGFEAEESTLGTEFRAGGLSGILASAAADARVTHLWGGETCVFR